MVSGGGQRMVARAAFPPSRLLVWHSSFDHARSRHASLVRGHAINQQLEIVLPTRAAADLAASLQWETTFYYRVTAPLALLLSERFINEYIVNGSLCMLASNVAIDSHNTAMILPTGELLLLVDNETYEQLGLVGHKYAQAIPSNAESAKSHRATRRSQRYVVSIDLTTRAFTSAAPNAYRDRVRHCLETKFEPLEMLVTATNERGAPRTIHFSDDDSLERTRVDVTGNLEHFREIFVPALDRALGETVAQEKKDMTTLRQSLDGVYDWLGVVACRLTDLLQQAPVEAYVSTFDGFPDGVPMDSQSDVSVVRWRGFMDAAFTQRVLDRTREAVANGTIPWAAMSVWGFPDTIVSWQQEYEATLSRAQEKKLRKAHAEKSDDTPMTVEKDRVNREHGFLVHGNNHYTFLMLPNHEYFALQDVGPHDATM